MIRSQIEGLENTLFRRVALTPPFLCATPGPGRHEDRESHITLMVQISEENSCGSR